MALQMATYLRGRMGNIVFYQRAGIYIARSVPLVVKQSAATKKWNKNFGVSATAGKSLRPLLLPVLPFPKNRSMQSRFSGAITKWIRLGNPAALPAGTNLPFISQFQFNKDSSITERWKIPWRVVQPVAGLIEVQLPAFIPNMSITAPAHTISVDCTITVASCLLADGKALGSCTKQLSIDYTGTPIHAQTISMPVPTPAGALVITAAFLQYRLANGQYCSKTAFLPASVIDARYC